jgi:hypothetical protein
LSLTACRRPYALNIQLVALGYALDAVGPDGIERLSPDPPVEADLRRRPMIRKSR